ncbi:MAG TPA: hypothetical protein VG943_00335 [Caulobacterales bacterium]|nr:hypothetical protein [Caulobacterales bacterium]
MARPRKGEITPVDDDFRGPQVQDHPERGRIEALFDQNLFRLQIRRERSAAFWMAASIWGTGGLVVGAILGGFMTLQAYVGLSGPVRDNILGGMAAHDAQVRAAEHPLTLQDPQPTQPQNQH